MGYYWLTQTRNRNGTTTTKHVKRRKSFFTFKGLGKKCVNDTNYQRANTKRHEEGKEMKKFDLEAAKGGAEIICRDSTIKARILCTDLNNSHYPLVVAFQHKRCDEICSPVTADGKYNSGGSESEYDLFMAPIIKCAWINIYTNVDGDLITGGSSFDTEDSAVEGSMKERMISYIGPYFIEVEV